MDESSEILDDGDLRKYYCQIPNMIVDAGLSVYALVLYLQFKRVTGELGYCNKTTETLAAACKMSAGSVSNAKKELFDAGLIRIEKIINGNGQYKNDKVTIVDIWPENMAKYSHRSPGEPNRSCSEPNRSPGELKNNLNNKNNQVKKINNGKEPAVDPADTSPELASEKSAKKKTHDPLLDNPAVKKYREIIHLTPNSEQRQAIASAVPDSRVLDWENALRHWLKHGWSPRNVIGMLDSFRAGGESMCKLCAHNGRQPRPYQYDDNSPELQARRAIAEAAFEKRRQQQAAEANNLPPVPA